MAPAGLLLLAASALAHTWPVHTVRVAARVEGDRLRVRFTVDAVFWKEEILGAEPPQRDWPPELDAKARAYALEHLALATERGPLTAAWEGCRSRNLPWALFLKKGAWGIEGLFDCALSTPAPPEARTLSGRVSFHREELEESREHDPQAVPWPREFQSRLAFPGTELTLPSDRGEFRVPFAQARRSAARALADCAFAVPLAATALPLAALSVALALWGAAAGRKALGAGLAAALTGLAAPLPPGPVAEALAWAAAAAAAGLYWSRRPARVDYLFGPALALLPFMADPGPAWDPAGPPSQRLGLLLGALAWASAAFLAATAYLRWESKRVFGEGSDDAGRALAEGRRRQLAALILAAAGIRVLAAF